MAKDTIKNRINRSMLRRVLFTNSQESSISRREVITKTGLNVRTVMTYTAELEKLGLISSHEVANGQGRPEIHYSTKIKTPVSLGIYAVAEKIYYVLLDLNQSLLVGEHVTLDSDNLDSESNIRKVLDSIHDKLKTIPHHSIMGIGMVIHLFNTHPKFKKFFVLLGNALQEQYHIAVRQCDIFNAMVFSYFNDHCETQKEYNSGRALRLGLISPSDKILFGMIKNEEIEPFALRTNSKRKKLFAEVMTHQMVLDEYKKLTGQDLKIIHKYRERVQMKDPDALKVAELEAKKLSECFINIKQHFKLDKILLINITPYSAHCMKKLLKHKNIDFEVLREKSKIEFIAIAGEIAYSLSSSSIFATRQRIY